MRKAKTQTKRGSNKLSQAETIRQFLKANPNKSVSEVAKIMGVRYQVVYMTKKNMLEKERKLPKPGDIIGGLTLTKTDDNKLTWKRVATVSSDTPLPVTMQEPAADPVNHPAHYKVGGIETIDFIEAKKLGYNLGNVVKYITRADHKGNRKQDLEKALWYLTRELKSV